MTTKSCGKIDESRIRNIVAVNREDFDVRVLSMNFLLLEDGVDLRSAVMDACKEYVSQTKAGWMAWTYNGCDFNWADFYTHVPNDICIRHGFRKLSEETCSGDDVEWNESLVSDGDVRLDEGQLKKFARYVMERGELACQKLLAESDYVPPYPPKMPEEKLSVVMKALGSIDPEELMEYYMEHVVSDR